jgi:nucleotide-binding universal stress UspA family protein
MKNIVVGISDAETSHIAGRQAFELAERYGATVHVVTAVEAAEQTVVKIGSDTFLLNDVHAAEQAMTNFVQRLHPGVEWQIHAFDEKPAAALVGVAEQVDADLIVVGNVRMQGIGRVLGSVGNDVLRHAPCNVLIVKTV